MPAKWTSVFHVPGNPSTGSGAGHSALMLFPGVTYHFRFSVLFPKEDKAAHGVGVHQ